MSDSLPLSARSFADFYGISRERLSRITAASLRDRAGVFGLENLGYFQAVMVDARRMEISPYTAPKSVLESIPVYKLKGTLAASAPSSTVDSASPSPARPASPAQDSDAPSKYELELRVLQERATALRQKNVLEQARLREETVSYCASAIQLILASLRADIDSVRLDPDSAARLRSAIDSALADLESVLPRIIAGEPVERIELDLSVRRADRINASRTSNPPQSASSPNLAPDPHLSSSPSPSPVTTSPAPQEQA